MNICCPKRDTISNGPISCAVDETVSAAAADRSGRWETRWTRRRMRGRWGGDGGGGPASVVLFKFLGRSLSFVSLILSSSTGIAGNSTQRQHSSSNDSADRERYAPSTVYSLLRDSN